MRADARIRLNLKQRERERAKRSNKKVLPESIWSGFWPKIVREKSYAIGIRE
jgi:hypothetical protein